MTALVEIVAPSLRDGARPVRAWSAGCATGEEAYSLAILLRQNVPASRAVQITGTDISAAALDVAAAGYYPDDAVSHVPDDMRNAFVRSQDAWRVADEFARLVTFERANLADGRFPRNCDVILCRNVLIYFEPDARRRTVDALIDSLTVGGYLFVGYSETLRDFPELEAVRGPDAVIYRKLPPAPVTRAPTPVPVAAPEQTPRPTPQPTPPSNKADTSVRVALSGRYEDGGRLRRELSTAMDGRDVVVDADGAEYLSDDAAAVFKRAMAAARAAGGSFRIRASRSGTQRWLRRNGLDSDREEEAE